MKIPDSIKRFVDIFSALPGIGPRQAIRLAFHFIYKGSGLGGEPIRAIEELQKIKICKLCFYIAANEYGICDICRDRKRNQKVIAIVEKETDLISIENSGKYDGRYLILGDLRKRGILEPDQKLKLQSLKDWIKKLPQSTAENPGTTEEIIIAVNPTAVGNLNARFIADELKQYAAKITRLGIGIPSGGEIEFADEDTLGEALNRR